MVWKTYGSSELSSSVEVEVDVLGSPSLLVLMVSVDVKQHLCSELRSCVKVEEAVLGLSPLIVRTVSVDIRQRLKKMNTVSNFMVFCTPAFEDDLFLCARTAPTLYVYTAHTQVTNLPLI